MSSTQSLLVELLAEELPPKALKRLGEVFASSLLQGLKSRGLAGEHSAVTGFATPRRLAAHVSAVHAVAPSQEELRKVMPMSVAFDAAGTPTVALRKALAKLGREGLADRWPDAWDGPDRLYEDTDGKVRALFLRSMSKGATLALGLQGALDDTIAELPIPKVMSYQLADGWSSVQFVRPVHGLVALHGAEVVPVHALGLQSGRDTLGHRFEAGVEPIRLQHADHYTQQLEQQGAVIAAFAHRRAEVMRQLQHAAGRLELKPIDDDALLDEVTALVERPNVLTCQFEAEFLAVPPECLILTMKANQKYFPLLDAAGKLTNRFLVVSNIHPDDASAVIEGNERVVRPRLADAKFFFDQDRKRTLESRVAGLDKVVYHAKLGSMGERVQRVRTIARAIGDQLGGPALAQAAERAALLAKADLLTDMVGEFPELQGVMGGYYARHDGEGEAVALAIEDHYRPRFAGDELPRGEVGLAVALADKLETLVGLFGIGATPTGDKDPFALRRHALGALRMLIERGLAIDLPTLLASAQAPFTSIKGWTPPSDALLQFFHERLAVLLREQGSTAQEVDAVLGLRPARLDDVPRRLTAVRSFAGMPEATPLAAANKRITNILKKSDADGAAKVEPALFAEEAERALHGALNEVAPRADALFEQRDYTASLRELAALKAPVDAFFDHVMVNAEDARLRANRLALLAALHRAMNRVADLSRLAT
ncbi:MAG TPA: glycine--tRNA ligase subunit beta [Burkholderiaceae bacterium]|nr:glycine--tRNA ligase subunit beta [Burkholderiaceae bacterium]